MRTNSYLRHAREVRNAYAAKWRKQPPLAHMAYIEDDHKVVCSIWQPTESKPSSFALLLYMTSERGLSLHSESKSECSVFHTLTHMSECCVLMLFIPRLASQHLLHRTQGLQSRLAHVLPAFGLLDHLGKIAGRDKARYSLTTALYWAKCATLVAAEHSCTKVRKYMTHLLFEPVRQCGKYRFSCHRYHLPCPLFFASP